MTVPAAHPEPLHSALPTDGTSPPTALPHSALPHAVFPADTTPPLTVPPAATSAVLFWVCAAVGVVMIVFGVHAVLRTRSTPIYWVGRWMLGLLVVHDGIITIVVGVAGWARNLPDGGIGAHPRSCVWME